MAETVTVVRSHLSRHRTLIYCWCGATSVTFPRVIKVSVSAASQFRPARLKTAIKNAAVSNMSAGGNLYNARARKSFFSGFWHHAEEMYIDRCFLQCRNKTSMQEHTTNTYRLNK